LKRPDEWDDDTAASVASFEVFEEFSGCGDERKLTGYTKRVRLFNKIAAVDKAMKHLGLYEQDNGQRAPNLALQIVTVGRE
jgi:phage terminase small subunit